MPEHAQASRHVYINLRKGYKTLCDVEPGEDCWRTRDISERQKAGKTGLKAFSLGFSRLYHNKNMLLSFVRY